MSRNDNRWSESRRGTVLVISRSSAFVEIVGGMLIDGGFDRATATSAESAWLSETRTHPVLVICDASAPEEMVARLIPETIMRRLPLLLLGMTDGQTSGRARHMPAGMNWLQFPLARAAFQSAIDELVAPAPSVGRDVVLSGGGVTVETGFLMRSLDEISHPR